MCDALPGVFASLDPGLLSCRAAGTSQNGHTAADLPFALITTSATGMMPHYMTLARRILFFLACLHALPVMAAVYSVPCSTQDYGIAEATPPFAITGVSTLRVGANNNNSTPSGRNAVL